MIAAAIIIVIVYVAFAALGLALCRVAAIGDRQSGIGSRSSTSAAASSDRLTDSRRGP